jgi:hypothetical protein
MGLLSDSELIVEERRGQVDISARVGCGRVKGTVSYITIHTCGELAATYPGMKIMVILNFQASPEWKSVVDE